MRKKSDLVVTIGITFTM